MKKYLGQHFLNNQKAIDDIVEAVCVARGDVIIEIGPGTGALTKPLAELCEKRGAKLFAIEKDAKLVIDIQKEVSFLENRVEHGDALEILPRLVSRYNLQTTTYKLIGNIPYYITGQLLRVISELEYKPAKTVLMIQKEVAERVSGNARKGSMNLLAAATQYWGDVKVLFTLKPQDFTPPPEVSSAVIAITPRLNLQPTTYNLQPSAYYQFIRAAFKQPRKTLLNNLAEGFPDLTRDKITDLMSKNGLVLTTRAQDLNVPDLERLASLFEASKSA
ncbi:MAG: 16S rRNA (adenine(1518)-N(6)/adenine(1519)-N(6))-dimethyltransferase RsmA [bacterium]|nr:16S rRNA (adenine(1518)-N(6)/adenine(1519)-N(6))-dimethyltransferase RsmA [bacterium]